MPVLKNAAHELYAQELAKGRGINEAYIAAGYQSSPASATRLSNKVKDRVAELLEIAAGDTNVTLITILAELEEARGLAKRISQPAPMITASMGKAKLCGIEPPEKVEHSGVNGGPIQISEFEAVRRIAFAIELAKRSNAGPAT